MKLLLFSKSSPARCRYAAVGYCDVSVSTRARRVQTFSDPDLRLDYTLNIFKNILDDLFDLVVIIRVGGCVKDEYHILPGP